MTHPTKGMSSGCSRKNWQRALQHSGLPDLISITSFDRFLG